MTVQELSLKKRWVELQCRGWSDQRIAQETGSDLMWVRNFLARNNLKALERMAKFRAQERAKQVMRLERMIEEAADAWYRSKMPENYEESIEEPTVLQQANIQAVPGAGPGTYQQVQPSMSLVRSKKSTRYKNGDIAYLKAMQGFMADVRSILKIDDGTRRIDLSLSLPNEDPVQANISVQSIAEQQLQEWNAAQKDRLAKMLEMPEPEIVNPKAPDPPLNDTNGDTDYE